MKKFEVRSLLALLLAAIMVFAFAACDGADETLPPETDPSDPVVTDPIETDPAEIDPVETDPAETDPVETDPIETDPVESTPAETEPAETDPPATEPKETEPTKPAETECAHKFGRGNVVIPTCKGEGYTEYTCTKCGETKKEDIQPKVDHLYVSTTISHVGCTTDGEIADVCSYCGDTKNNQKMPAYGHNYVSEIIESPSLTHHSIVLSSCESCGAVLEAKPAEGGEHIFYSVELVPDQVTDSGVTVYGYEVFECNCGYILKVSSNHADGHFFEIDSATGKLMCRCGEVCTNELSEVHNGNSNAGPVIFAE